MSPLPAPMVIVTAALALLTGCGPKRHASGHDHGHAHAHEEAPEPASFNEGRGLQLAPETAAALGVTLAPVEERTLAPLSTITANVFDAGPPARALALVSREVADAMEKNPPAGAQVISVQRDISPALTQVETVLALPGSPSVGATVELELRGAERMVLAVRHTAVLRSATGSYVYVENGGHLLRTAVRTAASDSVFTEIVDGLYAGDVVVTQAVEQLWLTELRLTKGGGHSH